jgi:hypothetical protein
MKTKPILISFSNIILIGGIFFFVCCRDSAKSQKTEISQFLHGFNNQIKAGNTDSLLAFFEVDKTPKILKRLINLLAGKKGIDGKAKPLAGITLDVDASTINILNSDISVAKIPVTFNHDSLNNKNSVITLKIHKIAPHQFKIIQVFISFLLQNTLWVVFTLAALILIRNGKIDDHIKMVRRSYSLAFGAVTLRFYIFMFTVFGNGVGFANNYIIIAFLSWIPNILVAEWINYRHHKTNLNAMMEAL